MITISDLKNNNDEKDSIVENLMKSNNLYCLVARPKVGKSFLALQLANSVANGTNFLGYRTSPSPVLYISTEMSSSQIFNRINKMNLTFNDENFFIIEQKVNERKLNLFDLQLQFKTFAEEYDGKFVIIDMLNGIDINNSYDLNNYQDMGQTVIPKFREICKKYDFTILFVHHLNKNNTSLGSTAIDGCVDGKFTLKQDNNIKNKFSLNYVSRDFESIDLILKKNDNLQFEVSEIESEDLNINILTFLNYSIKQKNYSFTVSEITSKLNLQITPSSFGKLLNSNIENLKKEGLEISQKRTATERMYYAKYEEPTYENE